jgi:adenine-specific DNA methylase
MTQISNPTFIETQFPIALLSAESYKERKSVSGQTLTGLGKWWGRKPLILVRACILGMLMPASADAKKDREVFLKLLTMDRNGLWRRRKGVIPDKELLAKAPQFLDAWKSADKEAKEELREEIWDSLSDDDKSALEAARRFGLNRAEFDALPYEEKLNVCVRPEHMDGPDAEAWDDINAHLQTNARSLTELTEQLGQKRFGHRPKVGDCFAGGGSIPFEAARLGCESFGSDLNPVAALLTWAGLNLVGGGKEVQKRVREAQQKAFAQTEAQVEEWGIERSEEGWRAEAYLYCVEVTPPGCDYAIPLSPSWVVGEKFKVCGVLRKPAKDARISIDIIEQANDTIWNAAKSGSTGTVKESRVVDPFDSSRSWSVESLRGPQGLRLWEKSDIVPRADDVFQERLYCIRWRKPDGTRVYRAPTDFDLRNEAKVLSLLQERIKKWQEMGYVPTMKIESGYNTDQPIRERGWTHWQHLFSARQLLINGTAISQFKENGFQQIESSVLLLLEGRIVNNNSRLSRWKTKQSGGIGGIMDVFSNQALNTLFNYSARSIETLRSLPFDPPENNIGSSFCVEVSDARSITTTNDIWITDPPYADAVNYHELADFFLAWYEKLLPKAFPEWIPDGRKALAVRGTGDDFKRSMVDVYKNLVRHMPDNGLQMVQFTHQNPAVWADLGMILWAAGLRVTAAWTVATETPAGGIKKGNYVQGTVLLVLRKRLSTENAFLDELYPMVEDEVRAQIDSMRALDDNGEPNFGDSDYQLAAYAAALRVLTQYKTIDGQDVGHELFRASAEPTGKGKRKAVVEKSRFEQVIDRAITIACDYLVPRGLEDAWRYLGAYERLYLRSLDVESRGEHRQGVYNELARGFGVQEYKSILQSDKANGIRIKTASDFGKRELSAIGAEGFAGTMLRQLLFAVHVAHAEESPEPAMRYLKDELKEYWAVRLRLVALLDWLVPLAQINCMSHWKTDADAARLLAGRLRMDHG